MPKIPDYKPNQNDLSERAREIETECRTYISNRKGSEPEILLISRFFFKKIADLQTEIKNIKESNNDRKS